MKVGKLGWIAAAVAGAIVAAATNAGAVTRVEAPAGHGRSHAFEPPESAVPPRSLIRRALPKERILEHSARATATARTEVARAEAYAVPGAPPHPILGRATTSPIDFGHRQSPDSHVDYRRYEIGNTTAYPYVAHGRLFVEDGDWEWSCSATIVAGANESTVATAAHCLYDVDGLRWPDAIYFAPGYRLGRAPFGYWPAYHAWVTGEWAESVDGGFPDERYDVGYLYVPPVQGVSLADSFGTRGVVFNLPRTTFSSFGYPADWPFDGERLFTCESAAGGVDANELSPQPNAMGCDMTGGSSGGGWIAAGTASVNSVVGYHYDDEPEVQYGPYFGAVAQAVYQEAVRHEAPVSPTPAPPTPTATPVPTATPSPTPVPDTVAPFVDALSDRPDPFSPNGDGVKDKTTIAWSVTESIPYATVEIYKGYGVVKSFGEGTLEPGAWFVKWAGRNDAGAKVGNGTYKYVIHVEDEAGNVRVVSGLTTVAR